MKTWDTGTTELAPGVFAYVQATGGFCIANAGIIAGRDDTTVVDALFSPPMTRSLLDTVKRVSMRPADRLLTTHHHVDHTLGNALFPASTRILAHARAKAEQERVGIGILKLVTRIAPYFEAELEGVRERLPDETFDGESLEIEAGGRRVRLLHYGTGHTRGDVMVHLPDERVLFAGDVAFFDVTPMGFEGHIGNWIKVCDRAIAETDAEVVVPGHGPVGTKDDLRRMRDYLGLVHEGSRRAFDEGATEAEAAKTIELGEFAEWADAERLPLNVNRCYQEFRGEVDEH
jgi:cyclase